MRPCSTCFHLSSLHYRQFHSTETAVLSVHNDIVRAVDNRELSLLVLLDLSAAFDTVFITTSFSTSSKIDSVYKTLLQIGSVPTLLVAPSHSFSVTQLLTPTQSTARYHKDPYSVRSASSPTLTTSVTSSSVSTACLYISTLTTNSCSLEQNSITSPTYVDSSVTV